MVSIKQGTPSTALPVLFSTAGGHGINFPSPFVRSRIVRSAVLDEGYFLDPKQVIRGYLQINARDLEEATDIAKTYPLLDQFPVEVREVKGR